MIYIHEADLTKIYPVVNDVIKALSGGMQRVVKEVVVNDDLPAFRITGCWAMFTMRLDIKAIKKGGSDG